MGKQKKTVAELERELALMRHERDQLMALLQELPVQVGLLQGPDHTFAFTNRMWEARLGGREAVGKPFRDAFPELEDSPWHEALDAVFGAGQPVDFFEVPGTVDLPEQPGRTFYGDVHYRPLRDEEGNVSGVAVIGQDVTDRVAMRRQLEFLFEETRRQAEELNRTSVEARPSRQPEPSAGPGLAERIIQHAPAGIAYLDRRLVFQWINPTFRALFRLPAEAVVGHPLIEVFPLAPALLGPEMGTLLAEGRAFKVSGIPLVRRDGGQDIKTFWDVQCHPAAGQSGPNEGVLIFATDVTARVENERLQLAELEAMRQADVVKLQLMDLVNYELRAPLHVMMGYGSILRKELGGELTRSQHEYLAKMMTATDMLAQVVDEVMTMSQFKAGVFGMFPRPAALGDIMQQAVASVEGLEARRIQLVTDVSPELAPVFVDRHRISQALAHLLDNAIKFSPEGGTVRVRAYLEGDTAVCEVEDAGPGIPAGEEERAFALFAQLDRSEARPNGIGLGLPIARAIAEAHGGTLTVARSSAEGTCFRLELPTVTSDRVLPLGPAERPHAQDR